MNLKKTLLACVIATAASSALPIYAADAIELNTSIAVTSNACTVTVTPPADANFAATLAFSGTVELPVLTYGSTMAKLLISSNCDLPSSRLQPSGRNAVLPGSQNVDGVVTSDGFYPMDFVYSRVMAYSDAVASINATAQYQIGQYTPQNTVAPTAAPIFPAGLWAGDVPTSQTRVGGVIARLYYTSPIYIETSGVGYRKTRATFFGNSDSRGGTYNNRVVGVTYNAQAGIKAWSVEVAPVYGQYVYGVDGKPTATGVHDGETLHIVKTLTYSPV